MSEQTLPHVTMTGDRTGEFWVTEEHPDGTLVVAPDTSVDAILRHPEPETD